MKKIAGIIAGLFLLYSVPSFSQCACCSSVGCGDNSGGGSSLVKKGKLLFTAVSRYTSFNPFSSQSLAKDANADTSFSVYNKSYQMTYTFSLTYGISNRLNATVTLPYSSISDIQTVLPGQSTTDILGTSQGLSNIKTSLQFVLLQRQYFSGWEVVPTIGIIAPTGVHYNVAKDGTFFDDQFQPGANAWVPVVGVSGNKMLGKKTLRIMGTYVFQDTDPKGNVDAALWNADASVYFPLTKSGCSSMKSGDTTKAACTMSSGKFVLSGFGGVQVEHVGQDIVAMSDGTKALNPNIGAFRTYASIGVVANINHSLFIPISVAIPFYQKENGYQVSVNYRLNVGLSFLL
ncbi:MAG TPA: hypothetical protein VNY36_08935 [Bacteroidia bacterium]|jgi:hypothetical protein|nr:hypothetical protein [Bacteroidia bacterium]